VKEAVTEARRSRTPKKKIDDRREKENKKDVQPTSALVIVVAV
jgi:hypothetical protein